MINEGQHESFRKTNLDPEELEAEIKLLKRINPKLLEVQEAAPPPNKKLKRWQLSKQRKRDRDREDPGVGVEALGAVGPDPPDPELQGGQPPSGEHVTEGAKKDILNFPIFNFKAKPAKPIEVKPRRVTRVKADKGKSKRGADDITKFFVSVDTTKPSRPTQKHTADKLAHSESKSNTKSDPS